MLQMHIICAGGSSTSTTGNKEPLTRSANNPPAPDASLPAPSSKADGAPIRAVKDAGGADMEEDHELHLLDHFAHHRIGPAPSPDPARVGLRPKLVVLTGSVATEEQAHKNHGFSVEVGDGEIGHELTTLLTRACFPWKHYVPNQGAGVSAGGEGGANGFSPLPEKSTGFSRKYSVASCIPRRRTDVKIKRMRNPKHPTRVRSANSDLNPDAMP
ncbi:hypothetical protein BHM03_00030436 [Ensete ventricosum]|nr:hypothetical protein BHM03_00030436 [Ensete ventricosum]